MAKNCLFGHLPFPSGILGCHYMLNRVNFQTKAAVFSYNLQLFTSSMVQTRPTLMAKFTPKVSRMENKFLNIRRGSPWTIQYHS